MRISNSGERKSRVGPGRALRHLLVFQFKLALDALRDLVFSPLSVAVFAIDALRRPRLEDSLYVRLMLLGRRSDAIINLFDAHKDAGPHSVDAAVDELQRRLQQDAAPTSRRPGHDH